MKKYLLYLIPFLLWQCGSDTSSAASTNSNKPEIEEDSTSEATPEATPEVRPFADLGGEEAVTTPSLFDKKSQVNNEDAMNRLISSGVPLQMNHNEPLATRQETYTLPERKEPVWVNYKALNLIHYLEDLLRFHYYQTQGVKYQQLVPLASDQLAPLDHQELAYSLVRPVYWTKMQGESFAWNGNLRELPDGSPSIEKLQDDPYRSLLNLYELSLNAQSLLNLKEGREWDRYYLFDETHPEMRTTSTVVHKFWERMTYDKAKELIEQKKIEEERQLKELATQFNTNATDQQLNNTLDQVLAITTTAIQTYSAHNDIRRFFEYVYRNRPNASPKVMERGMSIKRHSEVYSGGYGQPEYLPASGVKAIQPMLIDSPLPKEGIGEISRIYSHAVAQLTKYQEMQAEMKKLLARLDAYDFSEDEVAYFTQIYDRIQFYINCWQAKTDQFKELNDLPANEKTFALIPLVEMGEQQMKKRLRALPNAAPAKSLLKELRVYYYNQVRETEASFK